MFVKTSTLSGLIDAVRTLPPACDDSDRIERIRLLDELKSAAAAAQARASAEFAASHRASQTAAGIPAERVGRRIAAQVTLARRISPFHAQRYLGWATVLTSELPGTYTALRRGHISEWRAMIVARETAWLSREHRALVDTELAPRLETLGDRRVEAEAKKLAYRLDPTGYLARVRGAENDRYVALRPAPDVMCRLTGLLPVAQGVAAYAALRRDADGRIADGDARSRGQIMADTLVERLTGQTTAGDVPVEINLVMTDHTLLASRGTAADDATAEDATSPLRDGASPDEPAQLLDYGPIPAHVARRLVFGPSEHTPMWLRRLYVAPNTSELAAMDSRRRLFTAPQRHYLRLRDQGCRTPWCDVPIRHLDHVVPAEHGGPTSVSNGQGYCQACNHAKQAPGWQAATTQTPGEFVIITPTGHTYQHRPPNPPGVTTRTRARARSPVERALAALLPAA